MRWRAKIRRDSAPTKDTRTRGDTGGGGGERRTIEEREIIDGQVKEPRGGHGAVRARDKEAANYTGTDIDTQ